MTWLFTQVWLWSLAAFVLGSLLTWLLFVRPMRRRIETLTRDYEDALEDAYGFDYAEASERDTQWVSGVPSGRADDEYRPLDLLRPNEEDRSGRIAGPPSRAGQPEISARPDVDGGRENGRRDPTGDPQTETIERVSAPAPAEEAELTGRVRGDAAGDQEAAAPAPPAGPAAVRPSAFTGRVSLAGDVSPAEREPAGQEPAAGGVVAGAALSGQLRSLFEPVVRSETAPPVGLPYIPPAGTEVTQNIPRIVEEEEPLPHRTPGAGPRPGAENGDSAARARATATVEAEQSSAREGYLIKGHFASRQYHTPDSPQYDQIVAEVWFRTAADAEEAGFEPWGVRE